MLESTRLGGEATIALGKSAPPVAVVGATIAGFSLQDWVLVATLTWIVLQAAYLVWKWVREWKKEAAGG